MSDLLRNIFSRCESQQLEKAWNEETYRQPLGDYAGSYIAGDVELEDFLVGRVRDLLRQGGIVRVADIGGAGGTSWHRVGGVFSEEVQSGQLELFVTGMGHKQAAYYDRFDEEYGNNTVENSLARRCASLYGRLVTYVPTDLSTQRSVPSAWRRGLDIVHDRRAVTGWSKLPELHIRRLGELVSPRGLYMVERDDLSKIYGRMTDAERAVRLEGIRHAHERLAELGLTQVDYAEAGYFSGEDLSYRIFKGPEAAPVVVG